MRRSTIAAWLILPGGFVILAGLYLWAALWGGKDTAGIPLLDKIGGGIVGLMTDRKAVRDALIAVGGDSSDPARVEGAVPGKWLAAIGFVESRFRIDAVGDQGRSVGPTQIQKRTLANNGYQGDPMDLTRDPWVAARWTAIVSMGGARNAEGKVLDQTPMVFEDLVSWWNAGVARFADLPADHETRTDYYPKARAALVDQEGVA